MKNFQKLTIQTVIFSIEKQKKKYYNNIISQVLSPRELFLKEKTQTIVKTNLTNVDL